MSKVLVIGSGPIVIGQAAEFDYAGTQACKALREEGCEVVLVNPNPATIMTDRRTADAVYMEPLTAGTVAAIIERERPDGLLATLGGQTGLNLAVELAERGTLERYGVRFMGTPLEAIRAAEDRDKFRNLMTRLGQPVPESRAVTRVRDALAFARDLGFPVMVRPAYTLGGTGGGVARTAVDLEKIAARGLASSPIGQVLVERSLLGWAEIEYEVMRDRAGTVVTVCNMENVDPCGIHTGDSIVVAPSQTLTDRDYHRLRRAAHAIIEALAIEGGCNVQFAYRPSTGDYRVIEVNPRVSRSSALASKATGYPIARVAAKIALGLRLDEIPNPVTGSTYASFEPALDYVVVKIPRWPFDKFPLADRRLGTQMKATGEVMAIDRTFEGALQKAILSLDAGLDGLRVPELGAVSGAALAALVATEAERPTDRRLFVLAEALRRGRGPGEDDPGEYSPAGLADRTGIMPYFLERLEGLIRLERRLGREGATPALLKEAKIRGFSDAAVGDLAGVGEREARRLREEWGIVPSFYEVDTCAGEFPAVSPYFYSTYRGTPKAAGTSERQVPGPAGGRVRWAKGRAHRALVIGAGPIRIGQGIEFDYCSVHAAWALREAGWETALINNNPETVSTDFDTSDRLYFEPLTLEHVLAVVEHERPGLVFNQFGGQTALNLSAGLAAAGVPLAGTTLEAIDLAEDRERCRAFLDRLGLPQSPGGTARSVGEAVALAGEVGYPVMVRPSYVLGGRAMAKVRDERELLTYMSEAVRVTPGHPVLVDRFIAGREVEVDAVSDGKDVVVGGIFEHVEEAGIHSGDSVALYPAPNLTAAERRTIVDETTAIARALPVVGLVNVQFILAGGRESGEEAGREAARKAGRGTGRVYVLEINPRASRTVPILCKVSGVNLVALAVQVQLGRSLRELGVPAGLVHDPPVHTAKVPVFSFSKLPGVDPTLGPEMKSTGEVLGIGSTAEEALAKGYEASGTTVALTRPLTPCRRARQGAATVR